MILKVINHDFIYEMSHLCTVFFPFEKIKDDGEDNIEVVTSANGNEFSVYARVYDKSLIKTYKLKVGDDAQTQMSVLLFNVLCEITGFKPPWGILFGVRPAKLMHRYVEELGEERARNHFINTFLASPQKTDLALEVMHRENKIISLSSHNSFSLYVSIPFCPTRCAYCSFVSHSIEKTHKLLEPYVNLLCSELEKTGHIAKQLGLRLETIYFGGGTPTTLNTKQLELLLDTVTSRVDPSSIEEFTLEAGRPDTITEEKLNVIKAYGVTRISINTQTLNNDVLELIGRKHTAEDFFRAFEMARKAEIKHINTDLIAGLPGEGFGSFSETIDEIIRLRPDNLTFHTLCLKNAADFAHNKNTLYMNAFSETSKCVDYSQLSAKNAGYIPYYIYRQKNTVDNLENVGFALPGAEGLYNIYMMEEIHSIFAVGAGAVSKMVSRDGQKIDRIFEYKYPYEYLADSDGVKNLEKEKKIIEFYRNIW